MHGKIIQFKAEIDNFKVKNGLVTVNLTADTKDIVLDQLSEISSGPVMVNLEASQTELLPEKQKSEN
ncbi:MULTISPECIES: hypothetical protein [unclassified Lactobacillus]|uniref:hypothetical protein n=1 Tax=unclassified Lactobacillus TaxID=2620435 RepID=UPI000BEEE013|nr:MULTISPECIES: hypothetical protein [unclassified Lactobacillus]PEG86878.1 hypothetical protein CP365_05705 [Lactobacillus sp. UMNPBX14]PEH02427.1 hypothetical protein CP357_05705 [Lactobacillus sp. UMNPBX6]